MFGAERTICLSHPPVTERQSSDCLPALLAWPKGTKTQTGRGGTVVSGLRLGEVEQLSGLRPGEVEHLCLNSDSERWNSCIWTQTRRGGTLVSELRLGEVEHLCLNSDLERWNTYV